MKIRSLIIAILLTAIWISCGHPYSIWDISKFNMAEDALEAGEKVKLIYSSRGFNEEVDFDYYVHLVGISQKTGDTVNILTPINNALKEGDGQKVFTFAGLDHPFVQYISMDTREILEGKDLNELAKKEPKKIDKVARDPDFDYIADNDFPTVIGIVFEESRIE